MRNLLPPLLLRLPRFMKRSLRSSSINDMLIINHLIVCKHIVVLVVATNTALPVKRYIATAQGITLREWSFVSKWSDMVDFFVFVMVLKLQALNLESM